MVILLASSKTICFNSLLQFNNALKKGACFLSLSNWEPHGRAGTEIQWHQPGAVSVPTSRGTRAAEAGPEAQPRVLFLLNTSVVNCVLFCLMRLSFSFIFSVPKDSCFVWIVVSF